MSAPEWFHISGTKPQPIQAKAQTIQERLMLYPEMGHHLGRTSQEFLLFCPGKVIVISALLPCRALGIYQILIKITQKQWIKDKYLLNIGSTSVTCRIPTKLILENNA